MIIPIAALILTGVAYLGNRALPAIWEHHITQPTRQQVDEAKDLAKRGDLEAEKIQALQGMKPIVRLNEGTLIDATPIITESAKPTGEALKEPN